MAMARQGTPTENPRANRTSSRSEPNGPALDFQIAPSACDEAETVAPRSTNGLLISVRRRRTGPVTAREVAAAKMARSISVNVMSCAPSCGFRLSLVQNSAALTSPQYNCRER